MRQSTIIKLGASVAFGAIAVFLAKSWINTAIEDEYMRQAKPLSSFTMSPKTENTVPVVVVTADLNFGDILTHDALRVVEYPLDAVPEGTYETLNNIFVDPSKPTVVLQRLARNEAVLDYKISGPGARGSLSALIDEGMRAISVRVSAVTGVSGFVLPGDFVDVIYTRDEETRRNGNNLKSDILLQNVKVLGVDQNLNEMTDVPTLMNTVTLEVSNVDAQKLHLAQDAGKLSLTLRRVGDTLVEPTTTVHQNTLLVNKQKTAARRYSNPHSSATKQFAKPKPTSRLADVTIFRGDQRDQVQVIKDGETPSENSDLAGG